jgi:hypothetical protein
MRGFAMRKIIGLVFTIFLSLNLTVTKTCSQIPSDDKSATDAANNLLAEYLSRAESVDEYACLLDCSGSQELKKKNTFIETENLHLVAESHKNQLRYRSRATSSVDLGVEEGVFGVPSRLWFQTLTIKDQSTFRYGLGNKYDEVKNSKTVPLSFASFNLERAPFVMPIISYSEGYSIQQATDRFLDAKLVKATTNDAGDLVAEFLILPEQYCTATIVFGRTVANNPIRVTFSAVKKEPGDTKGNFAEIETKWVEKRGLGWVPENCTQVRNQTKFCDKQVMRYHWLTADELPANYFEEKAIDPTHVKDNRVHFFEPFTKLLKTDFKIVPTEAVKYRDSLRPK